MASRNHAEFSQRLNPSLSRFRSGFSPSQPCSATHSNPRRANIKKEVRSIQTVEVRSMQTATERTKPGADSQN